MIYPVTDVRSNDQDQIAYAVKAIGRSKHRLAVFLNLHSGRQRIKSVSQIAEEILLSRKRVLEEGKELVHKEIITQTTRDDDIAYERDGFYYAHKKEIVDMVRNPTKAKHYATKYSPKVKVGRVIISAPRASVRTATITVDQIDSFAKVQRISQPPSVPPMSEGRFKRGIQKILGEQGRFKDWGGETSDLYTTRLRLKGVRYPAAIAFKGRATQGALVPGKMGKNGDQIQRLFIEDADIFLVQHHGQITSSVMQLMAVFAQTKSISTGKRILYGVIDGKDSARIIAAYS